MDGFEQVRQAAQRLHETVVSRGADPLDPTALVAAALAHHDIDLVCLPQGDPALKNAKALFDEQSGAIFHEDAGDAAARALLIAHEIGHVEVHTGSTACTDADIDPSRSSEAAPVGLQRVEDYGAHERRELQANVFAREFLFPRSLAAKLHVGDEMTSVEIATRTGLPLPMVRQQIFDALLLPSPAPKTATAAPLPTRRDDSQDRAAAHRGTPFLLEAGPGTGKTRTLVKRVVGLIEEGIDPAAILVLTYSNRAAGELVERLSAAIPDVAAKIWVGTIHAFGLDLVRRHHDKLGLPPDPSLFDRSDAISVLEEILPTLPLDHYRELWDPAMVLKEMLTAISRAKDEMVGPAKYRELAEAMTRSTDEKEREAGDKCLEVAQVYEIYEKELIERQAVDFGDLVMRPALLLEAEQELRVDVQLRHRHVLVDEYQDVNRASARLLKAVTGDGHRLWVVGDARQSIYRFRGASSANMVKYDADYPGAIRGKLDLNYRSTQEVIDTFVGIAPKMGASAGMIPLALTSAAGRHGPKPQVRRYETLDDEAAGVAASIKELEVAGVALREQAVLCRSNRRLAEIAEALEQRGIPVLHLGSLFEREEIRDLLSVMSLVVDSLGDALVRVAALPRYGIGLQDIYAVMEHLRSTEMSALDALADLPKLEGLSRKGADGFQRLASDFAEVRRDINAWNLLSSYMLDKTDLVRSMSAAMTVTEKMRSVAVWQFLNFLREQAVAGSGLPIWKTLERIRQLVLFADERDLRQVPASALDMDAVRLMTVHGSKGLEFEAVHLPGLTTVSFPAKDQPKRCPPPTGMIDGSIIPVVGGPVSTAHDQEEECLFFVAISRAKTHLRIYLARKQPNGWKREASPFLDWLPPGLKGELADPATLPLPPGAPRPQPVKVNRRTVWHPSEQLLGHYETCPRRFFYTHVLGLRGARKRTAFTKTHDCLYELIRWLGEARKSSSPAIGDIESEFARIWEAKGPEHAYRDEYHEIARTLIRRLSDAGKGRRFKTADPLPVDLPNGRILVKPDELAELPDGTISVRRVRTGRRRSAEYDQIEYTLYLLAAQANFGRTAVVEALHLSDGTAELVEVTDRKVTSRREKSDEMLAGIAGGWFPPEVNAVTCPRCPHFFLCGSPPKGSLSLP